MEQFQGVFPIVNTPFQEDGILDLDSQRRLVRFLMDCGVHGLALFGNASEGYTLSGRERRTLMQLIIKEVGGRIPVIVSAGHTGTDMAVRLTREAEAMGADALMVLPPYFLRPDAQGIYQYFKAISDTVNIPVMVQDAPLLTQVSLSAELLARMNRELDRIRLVKVEAPPTAPKISQLHALTCGSLILFGGLNGQFLIEELNRGARGTMPGGDMADAFVRIWNLFQANKVREARLEFNRYLPLIRYELQPGLGVSVMKHNLKAAGIIASARVRHPTGEIDQTGLEELQELRQDLDLRAFGWDG